MMFMVANVMLVFQKYCGFVLCKPCNLSSFLSYLHQKLIYDMIVIRYLRRWAIKIENNNLIYIPISVRITFENYINVIVTPTFYILCIRTIITPIC